MPSRGETGYRCCYDPSNIGSEVLTLDPVQGVTLTTVNHDTLLIGDVARACEVSNDTIRHYEEKGVIPGVIRDENGYRRYPSATIDRVRVVRRALKIGFTLDELARIFTRRASGQPPCRGVADLAAKKLVGLDERIDELILLRKSLSETLESWKQQLSSTEENELAHLLESLK